MDLVAKETKRRDIITIVVVHDSNITLRHGEHILMLKESCLVAEGMPKAVITPEILTAVYGVTERIGHCSQGVPQLLIDRLVSKLF